MAADVSYPGTPCATFQDLAEKYHAEPKDLCDVHLPRVSGDYTHAFNHMATSEAHGRTFFGVSALETLNLATAHFASAVEADPDFEFHVVILDVSSCVQRLFELIGEVARDQDILEEAIPDFRAKVLANRRDLFFDKEERSCVERSEMFVETLNKTIEAGHSFFSSAEQYERIRSAFLGDRVVYVQTDATNIDFWRDLNATADAINAPLSGGYLSCLFYACARIGKTAIKELKESLPPELPVISTTCHHDYRFSIGIPKACCGSRGRIEEIVFEMPAGALASLLVNMLSARGRQ